MARTSTLPDANELTEDDRRIFATAFKLYVKNARACSGTLRGLGKDKAAEAMMKEADDVENRLANRYADQKSLALAAEG